MAKVAVRDNHLNFGGVTYFRGHAEQVRIGSYGEKRTPLTKMNYLEVKGQIPVPKINVATATVVDIDTAQTTSSAFSAAVSAIVSGVPVKFSGEATFNKLKTNELKLVKFSVMNNAMQAAVNDSPNALKNLADYGKDARIAHQLFVVMDQTTATKFDHDVSVNLSAGKGGLQATVGGSSKGSAETTVEVADGTGFAYLLLSLDWDKKKTRLEDTDIDQWSLG